jgi:hypothetical protein
MLTYHKKEINIQKIFLEVKKEDFQLLWPLQEDPKLSFLMSQHLGWIHLLEDIYGNYLRVIKATE